MEAGTFVYNWQIKGAHILLTGPIKGDKNRNNKWQLCLKSLPIKYIQYLEDDNFKAFQSFYISEICAQVIALKSRSGILIRYKKIINRLEKKNQYLKWLEEGINALPEAFVLYDASDNLLIANPQYEELYPTVSSILRQGVSFKEIAEKAVKEQQFKYQESDEEWLKKRMDFHKNCEGYFEQNLQDGRWIQLSERKTMSGGTTSIRADITLLKEREKALHQEKRKAESTSKSMERFLAVFSHEVR